MTAHSECGDTKKPSIAGGQIDTENDSALFIHDAADEHITVGGAFTIDGEKTSSAVNAAPFMAKNPLRVNREIYNK